MHWAGYRLTCIRSLMNLKNIAAAVTFSNHIAVSTFVSSCRGSVPLKSCLWFAFLLRLLTGQFYALHQHHQNPDAEAQSSAHPVQQLLAVQVILPQHTSDTILSHFKYRDMWRRCPFQTETTIYKHSLWVLRLSNRTFIFFTLFNTFHSENWTLWSREICSLCGNCWFTVVEAMHNSFSHSSASNESVRPRAPFHFPKGLSETLIEIDSLIGWKCSGTSRISGSDKRHTKGKLSDACLNHTS